MITLCPEGRPEITLESEEEIEAYNHLKDFYNGDKLRAYSAFYRQYRTEKPDNLNDRLSSYTIEGFNVSQQQDIVDTMKFWSIKLLNVKDGDPLSSLVDQTGYPKIGRLKSAVKNVFTEKYRDKYSNDQYRLNLLDKIDDNFDQLWKLVHGRLDELGLEVNDDGGIQSIAGGDFQRRNYGEDRFEKDPKDTASAKIKSTLSFIPKVEYKRDDGDVVTDEYGNKETDMEAGIFGKKFASMDRMYDNIGRILSDFVPPSETSKFEAYLDKIKEEVEGKNAQLERAVREIREEAKKDDTFKFDFVNAFGKSYTKNLTVTFKPNIFQDSRTGRMVDKGWTMRVFETNRDSQENEIKNSWLENQKTLPITRTGPEGDLEVNQSMVDSIKDNFVDEIEVAIDEYGKKSDEVIGLVQEYLGKVGITVPFGVINEIADNPSSITTQDHNWLHHIQPYKNKDGKGLASTGLMGAIFSTLGNADQDSSQYVKLGKNNPIFINARGMLDKLASISANQQNSIYAPSFMNGENNQVYAMQDHTILTKTFGKLKNRPEDALTDQNGEINQGIFNRQSRVLNALQNDTGNIREVFDLHYADVLREFRRSKGTPYDAMSTAEKELAKLSLFQRSQRNDKVRFLSPTLSDKTRDYILTLPKIHDLFPKHQGDWVREQYNTYWTDKKNGDLKFYSENDQGGYDHSLIGDTLYNMAQGEVERILQMQNWTRGNQPSNHPLGEDYVKAAKRFFIFPELNPDNLNESDRKAIYKRENENFVLKDPKNNDRVREVIKKVLSDRLKRKVNDTISRWEDLDIVPSEDGRSTSDFMLDSQYLKNIGFSNAEQKLTYAALDYQISQRFFNSNILQMLPGDPAQHINGDLDSQDSMEVHEQTMTNLQKRLANHIAPAITANWVDGHNKVWMATMQDRLIDTHHEQEYQKRLNDSLMDNYRDIESTDAQEYTTFKEHLIMARSHGKVKERVYNALVDKIDEVRQDPENTNNYFTIKEALRDSDEINNSEVDRLYDEFYLMPHKPVYVGEKYYDHLDSSHVMYRKTSSWPLIPEFTKNSDLDNLRLSMEGNGEFEQVQRAAFQTADKLGAYNPVDPFKGDERKTFKDVNSDSASDLSDLFVSVENAEDPNNGTVQVMDRNDLGLQFEIPYSDKNVTLASQMNRLLTHGIKHVTGIEIQGEEMNGRQVEEERQRLRKRMFEIGRKRLFEELQVRTIEKDDNRDDYEFENMAAVRDVLREEGEKRDWDPSAIDALELTDDGEFVIPLSFTPNTTQIESLLNSLINNRIIDQDMYGSNYVQTSGAGFHGLDGISAQPTVTSENYDPEQGLQSIREDEDGNILPAQVMIPWNFKDQDGNLLDVSDFTKKIETEDGKTRTVIDDEKLDPEIRKFIGTRIPHQSKSSALPIEVVGFFPSTVKKLMAVPDEIVAQMGSDFDVDKVTTYEDRYVTTSDGRIASSSEGDSNYNEMYDVKKKYKDLHWEVLTHPDVMGDVIQPLDSPYLSDEADAIEEMRPGSDTRTDFLNPHQQVEDHNNQQAGNDLIGIFSNFSNLNAMMEMYPQQMKASVDIAGAERGSKTVDRVVRFTVTDENGNEKTYELDRMGGEDSNVTMPDGSDGTIGDVLEMLQNASLDNAKELILDKINATTNTANVISALAMMNDGDRGIPLQHLARFFAQPAIKEINQEINRIESQINDEFVSEDTTVAAIQRVFNRLQNRVDGELTQLSESVEEADKVVNAEIPHVDNLTNALSKSFNSQDKTFVQNQRDVLDAYLGLYRISKALSKIQGTVNFGNRNGPGKSLLHARNKAQSYKQLAANEIFDNPMSMVRNQDGSDTEWGSAAENSFILADQLYSDLFHYNSPVFQVVKADMDQQTENGISSDQALKVFRNLRSFVFSTDGLLNFENVSVDGERTRLLKGEGNIAKKVKDAQDDGWGMDNYFIQRLRAELPDGENDVASVNYSADKGDKTDEIRVIQDFAELLVSNDDRKRELARDLVRYSFLVAGGAQSPTSFHNKVPLGYLIEEGMKEAIDGFDFGNNNETAEVFKEQYYQHNVSDARVITDEEWDIIQDAQPSDSDSRKITMKPYDINFSAFYNETVDGNMAKYDYISRYDTDDDKWRLYKRKTNDTYYEIDTLGDGAKVKEYDASRRKTVDSSIIEENRVGRDGYNPFNTPDNADPQPTSTETPSPSDTQYGSNIVSGEQYVTSVRNNVSDSYINGLLDFVDEIDTDFEVVKLTQEEMSNRFGDVEGHYSTSDPNKIFINRDRLASKSNSYVARTVLHEWIHKQTYDVWKGDDRTERQEELLNNLKSLMNKALNEDSENAPQGVLDESGDRRLMEFMSYAVANKRGQKWLSGIESSSENDSILQDILDNIRDLVVDIIESVGYDINSNSSLRFTIRDTLSLIEEANTTVRDPDSIGNNPESVSKEKRKEQNSKLENESKQREISENMKDNLIDKYKDQVGLDQKPLEQQKSLNKTIGELRSTLTDRQKEIFDNNRTRFQTKC